MKNRFKGAGVALVTPFNDDKTIDFDALAKLINYVSINGVDYLVVLGTTAETPTLSAEEKQQIIKFVINNNNGNLPIVLGLSANNTAELVNTIKNMDFNGIDAILSVTPYYNKPSQQGICEHYKLLAEASKLPVIMYNVPGRTGVNMTAETTLKLAYEIENIIGIKEASGNMTQISHILRNRPKDFFVISGDDALALPQMAIGMDGVISVAANIYPAKMSEMISLALHNKYTEASKIHLALTETFDLLFAEGSPAGVKAMLNMRGIIKNNLRLPLTPVSEELILKIKNNA
jgi:4-hydroxy-tetrahydrodipicolinate synthase